MPLGWQVTQPGAAPKFAPKPLSLRQPEWQVRHPAFACWAPDSPLPGVPSPDGWLATRFTWESAWQRSQFGLVSGTAVPFARLEWTVRMATPPTEPLAPCAVANPERPPWQPAQAKLAGFAA